MQTTVNVKAEDRVAGIRESIDNIDQQIIQLLLMRRGYSQAAQAIKAASGISLVDIKRETTVLETYKAGLISNGPAIAHHILSYCKHKES